MHLGKVIGTVVPTIKYQGLEGVKFLIVQPLDKHSKPKGRPFVAGDATAMAGPDELIYYESSREAALAMPITFVPVDHAIIGIVDAAEIEAEEDR